MEQSPSITRNPEYLVGHTVLHYTTTDSTNEECKRRADGRKSSGLVIRADEQSHGKGRQGRTFQSLSNRGLYLSALLYPDCDPTLLSQITAWTAVAVSNAVFHATGTRPSIKWPNDLVLHRKKLCGILTELGTDPNSGEVFLVIGIGINLSQTPEDFGPDLSPMATSLAQEGIRIAPDAMADSLIHELDVMYQSFPGQKDAYLSQYRDLCLTVNRPVTLIRGDHRESAQAIGLDDNFGLMVRKSDGSLEVITSGEVSVRGIYGYT